MRKTHEMSELTGIKMGMCPVYPVFLFGGEFKSIPSSGIFYSWVSRADECLTIPQKVCSQAHFFLREELHIVA